MFRKKVLLGIAAGVFCMAVSSRPALAGAVIDFSQFGSMVGDVTDLGGGHITGTGILISQFAWFDMPIGTGSMTGLSWTLDFDSQTGLRIHDGATDLLVGSFSSTMFFGGPLGAFFGDGSATVGATLAAFLGIDASTAFDFSGFVIGLQQLDPDHYTAFSTDIGGTGSVVPEPGSMTLLGLGLIGAARGLRRKFSLAA